MPASPEFSRPFALDAVSPGGVDLTLSASPPERRALAARFDLAALDHLTAELRLGRAGERLVHVGGTVRADLAQRCVVTLEPVPRRVEASFDRLFSRDLDPDARGEVEIDALADEPEPLPEGGLDLGEIVAEELSLALDPYPRAPDAERQLAEAVGAAGPTGPFDALAKLRRH